MEHHIVSISQPWLRPIVMGNAKASVEFGAKLDLSIDEKGYSRIEYISFEAYNDLPRKDFGEDGYAGLISRH